MQTRRLLRIAGEGACLPRRIRNRVRPECDAAATGSVAAALESCGWVEDQPLAFALASCLAIFSSSLAAFLLCLATSFDSVLSCLA